MFCFFFFLVGVGVQWLCGLSVIVNACGGVGICVSAGFFVFVFVCVCGCMSGGCVDMVDVWFSTGNAQ